MSYNKIKVDSVEIVITGLSVANTRMGRVISSLCPYDDATKLQIPLVLTDMLEKKEAADTANGNLADANAAIDAEVEVLRKYQNSFFGLVNFKIKDTFYPPTIRTPFGIAITDGTNPYNDSEMAVELLVPRMITGNNAIISRSLPLMVDYNVAHASDLLASIVLLKDAKIDLEVIAGTANTELHDSEVIGIALVESMWAQSDYFYRLLEAPAKRDAERLWGVVYEGEKISTDVNIKAKFLVSGLDANGATIHIGKALTAKGKPAVAGVTATIEANGAVIISTTQEGPLVITGKCVGCVDIVQEITIVPGVNQAFSFAFVLV